jgi:hypothetical protein
MKKVLMRLLMMLQLKLMLHLLYYVLIWDSSCDRCSSSCSSIGRWGVAMTVDLMLMMIGMLLWQLLMLWKVKWLLLLLLLGSLLLRGGLGGWDNSRDDIDQEVVYLAFPHCGMDILLLQCPASVSFGVSP